MSGNPVLVQVVGPSGSGKTWLIERLIPRLAQRELRIGTIKHAHDAFDVDQPGKDSWRYAQAGAQMVALVGPRRTAYLTTTAAETTLDEAVRRIADHLDVILVEGFHRIKLPRIQLAHGANAHVLVEDTECRIGVQPDELSEDELERVTQFVIRNA